MGVARAWSRWPTEIISPSLIHSVNDFLSDVGSKKAISIMVLEINVPPHSTFSVYALYSIYHSAGKRDRGRKSPLPLPCEAGEGAKPPTPLNRGRSPLFNVLCELPKTFGQL